MNVKYFAVALLSTSALAGTAWAQETQDQPAAATAAAADAGAAASDSGDIVVTAALLQKS
ncbi:hypothetical protein [Sphingobium sp. CFD-1]|uniref:hypothetical protein n=1 Tax=Sphingobium sp. CFD-1 TaxID=2878545 RepID=UPI00214ABC0A|nr:hypothetical protein [Sphingobium sp. CFD-1]